MLQAFPGGQHWLHIDVIVRRSRGGAAGDDDKESGLGLPAAQARLRAEVASCANLAVENAVPVAPPES